MAGWIKEQLDKPRDAITDDRMPGKPQSLRYAGKAIADGVRNMAKDVKNTVTGTQPSRAENRYRSR